MKVSEFLEVTKDTEMFYIKEGNQTITDNDILVDRDDIEIDGLLDREIKEITFVLDVEKSCKFMIDVVPVIFIE